MKENNQLELLVQYKERIQLYNNYSFLKEINTEELFNHTVVQPLLSVINSKGCSIFNISSDGYDHIFYVKHLQWDSEYFGRNCYSIELILFDHDNHRILRNAINNFIENELQHNSYVTVNTPSEDLVLVQALGSTRFNLIETRLNYYLRIDKNSISDFDNRIKPANLNDIPCLREIAKKMRNRFDRVHADTTFSDESADEYLAKFIEESVKGFADIVLKVEDEEGIPFGFLAGNYPNKVSEHYVSKLVLAAIDSSVKRGRLKDLLKEIVYQFKLKHADYLTTITQAANIPAIRVWENAGFKLFKITHLYSLKND